MRGNFEGLTADTVIDVSATDEVAISEIEIGSSWCVSGTNAQCTETFAAVVGSMKILEGRVSELFSF